MDEDIDRSAVHQWERRLLIVAFTGWAAVVAAYGQAAVNRIDKMVEQMEKERLENIAVHSQLERRLTITEKDDMTMFRAIEKLQQEVDQRHQVSQ